MKRSLKPFCTAILAGAALCAAGAASAGETTTIHEYRRLVPDRPTVDVMSGQATQKTVVHKAVAHRHRALVRHVVRRTVATRDTGALNAKAAAVDTSAETRADYRQDENNRSYDARGSERSDDATVVERRTVIRRDDDGNVSRHTRTLTQGPDGMTSVEHRSSEGPDMQSDDRP